MAIIFEENDKRIVLDISGYQFEGEAAEGMNGLDLDWLSVSIEYTSPTGTKRYSDSCLLASELKELISEVSDIVSGKETGMITDFMEPYLKFSITRVEGLCAFQIRYAYSTEDDCWEELYVSQGMNLEELQGVLAQLKAMSEKYPVRSR